jgi:hypothetical protein
VDRYSRQRRFRIGHWSCYSYIQSSPVKVLAVIEERKHLHKAKDTLSFEIWIFHSGKSDSDDDRIIIVGITSSLGQCSLV